MAEATQTKGKKGRRMTLSKTPYCTSKCTRSDYAALLARRASSRKQYDEIAKEFDKIFKISIKA